MASLVVVGAACGGDDDDDSSGDDYTAVITAISFTSNAGLHGIDESINDAGEVPADARTVALRSQAVVEVTEWPDELQAGADELAASLGELAAALDSDDPDIEAAGAAAADAHDTEHEFSGEVWDFLYAAAGIEGGGEAH
jgi:hypothetical protein